MTRWFGASLAFHLLAIGLFILPMAGENSLQPIMIDLSLVSSPFPAGESGSHGTHSAAWETVRAHTVIRETLPLSLAPQPARPPLPQTPVPQVTPTAALHPLAAPVPQQPSTPGAQAGREVPSSPARWQTAGTGESLAPPSGASTAGSAVVAANGTPTSEKARNRYLREHFGYIRDLIMGQLVYPPLARRMNWSGKVTVGFLINENGEARNIRVVESSGYVLLDRSATETVKKVAPFPKPPVPAEIMVPVSFKLL